MKKIAMSNDKTIDIVNMLNQAMQDDLAAMTALFNYRTCADGWVEGPILVDKDNMGSVLGIINTLMDTLNLPRIAAKYDTYNNLIGFQRYKEIM